MAKVILKLDYVQGGSKNFSGYIDYMDREQAKENTEQEEQLFHGFVDYMDRDQAKGTGLFSASKDKLSDEETEAIKKLFNEVQEQDGIMWRFTFSFQEGFLEQLGLAGDGFVHEDTLKDLTRKSIDSALKKGKFQSSAWVAEIHHNTDNTHIHVALTDPSLRKKDGFIPGVHRIAKSVMVNELMFMDRPDIKIRQQKINDIIREDIIPSRREEGLALLESKPQKQLFLEIFSRLPQDTRKWHYHMNALKELRPLIDTYTRQYLDIHHGVVIKELEEYLKDQVEDQKIYYGDGEVDVNLYAQNKMNDLYGRLGNVLLKEMTTLHHGLKMNPQGYTSSPLDLLDEPRVKESMEQLNKRIDRESKKYLNSIAYYKIKVRIEKAREK